MGFEIKVKTDCNIILHIILGTEHESATTLELGGTLTGKPDVTAITEP